MAIDKTLQAAIDQYGDDIRTLEDFQTAVRTRPGMYIGPIGTAGYLNMMREIFQNAVDQMMMALSPADHFDFYYDERTLEVCCEDNGLGLPFNDIIRILTEPHTSKNFDKKKGDYSSGLNGIGAKVVNALSSVLVVESYRYDGEAVRMEFKNGYPTTKKPQSIPNKKKKQGTKISFIPDQSIMGDCTGLSWQAAYQLIKLIMCQTVPGNYMNFIAHEKSGKVIKEKIVNKDGIITPLIMNMNIPIIKPIIVYADDGFHKLNCAFCFDSGCQDGPLPNETVTAFSNFCPTTQGTHINGVVEGICRWFSNYMNSIFLANQKNKKNKLTATFADIRNGLHIMISAAHLEPEFTGQAKEILSNKDMLKFCKDTIMSGLDNWSKQNPNELQRICKFFKDMAEVRQKSDSAKAKVASNYSSSPFSGLPSKYVKPLSDKKDVELIIVEGDSAKGTVVEGRDPQTQGIFPIRGKIINAFKCSMAKFFANQEVQSIHRIIWGKKEYSTRLDPNEAKVRKIIIMADADVDGAHISALLLRMFIKYYPQLIMAGMLYKAIPPLYSIPKGKRNIYFTENIDIVKYIQKIFVNSYTITDMKNNKLTPREITSFFLRNADYLYYLEDDNANMYAIPPDLLELILIHYLENDKKFVFKKLNKEITKRYRFMNECEVIGDSIKIQGSIKEKYLFFINDTFIKDCQMVLKILESNDSFHYKVNGEKTSIYGIMSLYDKCEPSSVQRYKGLGEMDAEELAESTLKPGSNRMLIQYTLDNATEEIETIREYESNPKLILKHIGKVTREDLLD